MGTGNNEIIQEEIGKRERVDPAAVEHIGSYQVHTLDPLSREQLSASHSSCVSKETQSEGL